MEPTINQVINYVMRHLSFVEMELDGEAGFGDDACSSIDKEVLVSKVKVDEVIHGSGEAAVVHGSGKEAVKPGNSEEFVNHGTYDDDGEDDDFLVDEENEIVEPDVDVYLFGISKDVPFDNTSVTSLVPKEVLEGEDVDVVNVYGFESYIGYDNETSYHRKRRLNELRRDMEGVVNDINRWKYSFYYRQKFGSSKEAKSLQCHNVVDQLALKQELGVGPSGSSGLSTRSKKRKSVGTNNDSQVSSFVVDAHDKGDLCHRVLCVAKDKHTKNWVVSMSKAFRAKAKAEREVKVKQGFKACRREMLGLNDAFMKSSFLGQVLAAIGLDSNNGIYPLAYALVEAESKSSWCWFLQSLGIDIDLQPN
ncbi:mutator type transposase [Tanacetum coccineum]